MHITVTRTQLSAYISDEKRLFVKGYQWDQAGPLLPSPPVQVIHSAVGIWLLSCPLGKGVVHSDLLYCTVNMYNTTEIYFFVKEKKVQTVGGCVSVTHLMKNHPHKILKVSILFFKAKSFVLKLLIGTIFVNQLVVSVLIITIFCQ